ncbi:MAG: hypothetical protein Q9M94_06450 [Candidatus Gracilibacteria bacterium]|nr:hypothetical protein [Candidatus Gracilibacteria bacterium]
MLKKIILTLTIIFFTNIITVYADDKKGVLFYEQCNMLLERSDVLNIQNLGENLCIVIQEKGTKEKSILTKKKSNFDYNLIKQEIIDYLREKYYRGERINITFSGEKINLKNSFNNLYNTTLTNYKINFLDDVLLGEEKYEMLTKDCVFDSYFPTCENNYKQNITEKIENMLLGNIFNINKILTSSLDELEKEINKINIIKNKIEELDNYYSKKDNINYTENIKFTIKYLIYKLDIYNKVLENRILDLDFNKFLKEKDIYYIDKKLVGDLYISQSDYYTFFYYGKTRINTLNTNLSHFEESVINNDPKLSTDLDYLKKKIRDKYSAEYIKETDNKLILITKDYVSKTKYLLFDTTNKKIFEFFGKVVQIEKGKKGYYMLLENYNKNQFVVLYNGKALKKISETKNKYFISNFELLVGKKVKINYILKNGDKNNEIIDISGY